MTMSQVAAGGIALGRLAEQKANGVDIKEFGRRTSEVCTNLAVAVSGTVAGKQVTLPVALSPDDLALRNKLQNLSGDRFDRTYTRAMEKRAGSQVKNLKNEIKHGRDPAILKFASETLPVLEDHLEKARSLHRAAVGKRVNVSETEKGI